MSKVSSKTKLDKSATAVWDVIGGFNALPDWHPAVEKSELADGGSTRKLSLAGGGEIVEELTAEGDKSYSYRIASGPLPVSNYRSTVKVTDDGDGCTVEWSSEFDPVGPAADAENAMKGVYEAGLENLKKMMGG